MLLDSKPNLSLNEISAYQDCISHGIRPSMRKFDEARKLQIQPVTTPGVATVHIGSTSVTAITTGKLIAPRKESPAKGEHKISVFRGAARKSENLQRYFNVVWSSARIIEEESLCVKIGEKVWSLLTQIVVHTDDGSIIDACLAALVVSLRTIMFPSFDSMTGLLFSPTFHRPHRIAMSSIPVCVTTGFIGSNKDIIVDPDLSEMIIDKRFASFIFNESNHQIFLDAFLPGDIEKAHDAAAIVAKERRIAIDKAVNSFKPNEPYCLGSPQEFAGYEPTKSNIKFSGEIKKYQEIEVWTGDTKGTYVINFDTEENENNSNNDVEIEKSEDEDWLFSSIC